MTQGYFQFWYSQFLISDKLRLNITGQYKQQSSCAFTWCVRTTAESWKRDRGKETTECTAAWCWKLTWNPHSTPSLMLLLPTPIPWQHCVTKQKDTSGTVLLKTKYFPVGLAFNGMKEIIWITTVEDLGALIWDQREKRRLLLSLSVQP